MRNSIPLLQQFARGHPPHGDAVCALTVVRLRQVEDLLFERGIGEKERSPNSETSRQEQTFAAALAGWRQLPA